jgi:hypothetical protein
MNFHYFLQPVPGEAEVRYRGRQPAVLPLQLALPQHGARQDRPRAPVATADQCACAEMPHS